MPVTQKTSIAHLATDPLRNFKFIVSIGGVQMGFMSVSGLNITTEVISYREGSMNTTTQKMPGQSDFSPITLSRGVAVGSPYEMLWMKQLFTVIQGTGTSVNGVDFRQNIDVKVLDHPVTQGSVNVLGWFRIYNAWPTTVSYSDLDAGASQLLVAQLSLAHEGWDFELSKALNQDAATPS
jgi:phage tail-like protein